MKSTNLLILELSEIISIETKDSILDTLTFIADELLEYFSEDINPCCLQNKSRKFCSTCGSPIYLTDPFHQSELLEYGDVFTDWLMGAENEYTSSPKIFSGNVFVFPEAYLYIHYFTSLEKYSKRLPLLREYISIDNKFWDEFINTLPF